MKKRGGKRRRKAADEYALVLTAEVVGPRLRIRISTARRLMASGVIRSENTAAEQHGRPRWRTCERWLREYQDRK